MIISSTLRNFSHYFFKYLFLPLCTRLLVLSLWSPVHFSPFSPCSPDWIISIDLFSSSLTFLTSPNFYKVIQLIFNFSNCNFQFQNCSVPLHHFHLSAEIAYYLFTHKITFPLNLWSYLSAYVYKNCFKVFICASSSWAFSRSDPTECFIFLEQESRFSTPLFCLIIIFLIEF